MECTFHIYDDYNKNGIIKYNTTAVVKDGHVKMRNNNDVSKTLFNDSINIFNIQPKCFKVNIKYNNRILNKAFFLNTIDVFMDYMYNCICENGLPPIDTDIHLIVMGLKFIFRYNGGIQFTITYLDHDETTKPSVTLLKELNAYKWLSVPLIDRIKKRYNITDMNEAMMVQMIVLRSNVDLIDQGFLSLDDTIIKAITYYRTRNKAEKAQAEQNSTSNMKNNTKETNIWYTFINKKTVGKPCRGNIFYAGPTEKEDFVDREGDPIILHGVKL
jgi:hypothetical protein